MGRQCGVENKMSSHLKEKHFIVTVALATTKKCDTIKYIAPYVQIKIIHLRFDHFTMNGITHFDCFGHVQGWVPLWHQNELVN